MQTAYFASKKENRWGDKKLLAASKAKEAELDELVRGIVEAGQEPKPLRRLTQMTYDEFHEFIAGRTRFHPDYMDQKIKIDFGSLAGFMYTLGYIGEFDSFRKIKEAGFDVEFTLDREGEVEQ